MTTDDWLYSISLLLSILIGYFVRKIKDPSVRQLTCTLAGFVLLSILSGIHILHHVILTVVNSFIVLYVDKNYCHIISFIYCFSHLMLTRSFQLLGVPSLPELSNTALMIMVLKMVGLAFEVNIHYLKSKSSDANDILKEKYMRIKPGCFDIFQYSFCYAGLIVGPYYKFRTYEDLFKKPYSTTVTHSNFLMERIIVIPLYASLYFLNDYFFPLSYASSQEILTLPVLSRLLYVWPWFFSFRMRIYVAFVLGECICINLGIGAYPEQCNVQPGAGPTNLEALEELENNPKALATTKYNFETVRSMNEYASEFYPTMREGIRYWNMTVQYWLAIYIYKKTPSTKAVKMIATMFVSSIWHGILPGYYLSLLGTPLLLLSEAQVEKAIRDISKARRKVFDFVWYFVKMQCISYIGLAFILLDIKAILHYWSSVYYSIHFFTVFIFVIAFTKNKLCCKINVKNNGYLTTELNKLKPL